MLSIAINVKNAQEHLANTLKALSMFDDIVLLDNFSTDNTLQIAKQFSNVKIHQAEFQGMGHARNLIAAYAKYDWLLFVDCDEILEQNLVHILLNYSYQRGNVYSILRKNYYNRHLVTTSSWGNDWIVRLYNRLDTSFAPWQVHETLTGNLPIIKIHGGAILHFPYRQISQLIHKMQFYSSLYAKQYHGIKKPQLWLIPIRAAVAFFKHYILQKGFLAGYEGLIISYYNATGVFCKYIKLYELNTQKNFTLVVVANDLLALKQFITHLNHQTLLPAQLIIINDIHAAPIENPAKVTQLSKATLQQAADNFVGESLVIDLIDNLEASPSKTSIAIKNVISTAKDNVITASAITANHINKILRTNMSNLAACNDGDSGNDSNICVWCHDLKCFANPNYMLKIKYSLQNNKTLPQTIVTLRPFI